MRSDAAMLTRELDERDGPQVIELLRRAAIGCRFADRHEAEALWLRWLIETTLLGSFARGALLALRVFDTEVPEALRHPEGLTLRQRALVVAPEAIVAGGAWDPRLNPGLLAYYAAVGAQRIVVSIGGTAFERAQAAAAGYAIHEGLAGTACVVYDVAQLRARAGATA